MPERFFMSAPEKDKTVRNDNFNGPVPECFKDELLMLKNVKFTLCTNTDIIQSLPSFVQALDTFENYINKISSMYKDTKTRLIKFTCRLATAVNTYGVMTENNELITESSFDEDDLENQSDENLLNKSRRILEHSRMYLQAPNPFGIYHEIFVECEDALDNFGYATDSMTQNAEKNSWKKEHDRLFINAHEFMKETLDRLVDSLKAKHPRFYREYQKSRIVEKPVIPPVPKKTGEENFEVPF